MEATLEKIREQQRETWDRSSPGWKKWDGWVQSYLGPQGDAIIAALQLEPTDVVLDIATGTGEPGLTIATMVPEGKVVAAMSKADDAMSAKIKAGDGLIRKLTEWKSPVSNCMTMAALSQKLWR